MAFIRGFIPVLAVAVLLTPVSNRVPTLPRLRRTHRPQRLSHFK